MGKKQPPRKHVPLRTCVVCRQKLPKRELFRLVHTADEGLVVDPTGKRSGRGAYLCAQPDCWNRAMTTSILDRALGVSLSVEEKGLLASQKPQVAHAASGNME
jgi:predicted RNA-binding protein YlxR (DUF448 family)